MNMGKWGIMAGMGIELLVVVGAFLYAGQHIDGIMEWPGYAMTMGGMFGLIVWLAHVVVLVKKLEKMDEEESSKK